MSSLVCNTPESARLLGSPFLAVSTDKPQPGSKSRCSAGNAHRGPSPYPALEAFILRHALQVSFAQYTVCLRGAPYVQRLTQAVIVTRADSRGPSDPGSSWSTWIW